MRWNSALSQKTQTLEALKDCCDRVLEGAGAPPDVAFVFPSAHHAQAYEEIPKTLKKRLRTAQVLGCSGGGVIAGGKELEHDSALGLLCGWLPQVRVHAFRLDQAGMPGPDEAPKAWSRWLGLDQKPSSGGFVMLCDPFSLDPDQLARGLDYAFPGSVKVGGLASGASAPGQNALFFQDQVLRGGAVGALFEGNIVIDPIVAQGCRPIGRPMRVTSCHQNLLIELDGEPALQALEKLVDALEESDRMLAMSSLFLGVLGDAMKDGGSKRDYLIRNLLGLDPEKGVLAVGAYLRPGQTVQFHLRDGRTSSEDLTDLLGRYMKSKPPTEPRGALLFSCMGRGEGLYGRPNFDSDLFFKNVGPVPLGGFFCNGELGPVDGTTYLHGYTSSFGIFRPVA